MVRLNGRYDPWLGNTSTNSMERFSLQPGQELAGRQKIQVLSNPAMYLCPNNDLRVKQECMPNFNLCTPFQGQAPMTPITPSMLQQQPNCMAVHASPAPSVDLGPCTWYGGMGTEDLGLGSLDTPIFSDGALEEAYAAILSFLQELDSDPKAINSRSLLSLPTATPNVSRAPSVAGTDTPGSSRCVSPAPPFSVNTKQPIGKFTTLLCPTPPATPIILAANGFDPQVKVEACAGNGSRQEESDGPVSDVDQSNGSHRECSNCHTTETTMWRRHPINGYLCNPCGAYLRAHGNNRPIKPPEDPTAMPDALRCENCQTTSTIMWRQTPERGRLCNACGLFWRKHRKDRPLKLCKNMVCKRRRHRREVVVSTPGTVPRPISYAVPGHYYIHPYQQIAPITAQRQIVFHNR